MSNAQYNPEIHHRKSIRLKGHDYAGGGLYFVTICAHREFVKAANGKPFWFGEEARKGQEERATRMSPVRALMEEEMRRTAELLPWMQWKEYAIMPDHFHALIAVQGGYGKLGDVVGGFKAGVTRSLRRRGGIVPALNEMSLWQRNYYETIVWHAEAEQKIAEYIRMNPWKLIVSGTHEGHAFRAIGNPNVMNFPKLGVLCSRKVPGGTDLNPPEFDGAYMSGFHSPPEKEILNSLFDRGEKVICCPSWGIDTIRIPEAWLPALEANRMMILEMTNREGNLIASEARNRFVLQIADQRWLPYVTPGGMLERLVEEPHRGAPSAQREVGSGKWNI